MKKDNLLVGIAIIISTFIPIISIAMYEITTGNYIGYYGSAFLIPICLGILVIISAFEKNKENKDE